MRLSVLFIIPLIFGACNSQPESESTHQSDPIEELMADIRTAHGELGNYSFVFRGNTYSFRFDGSDYTYEKTVVNDSLHRHDVLSNEGFTRTENEVLVSLNQIEKDKYAESVNSVVYFVCLPLKLDDPAVNKELLEPVVIENANYDVLKVTFDEEGGGTDHDDIFYYWINQETHQMDFLAYQYAVSGGGVRFRSAFNSRMEEGMRFQDYINYGAPIGTPLDSLPVLFERNELEKLSEIITENVVSI